MPLASFTDANAHLDGTKIVFSSDTDALPEATSTDRMVRARLGVLFPTQAPLWDFDPTVPKIATPELVREIASLLMASFRYASKYSEDDQNEQDYAQKLYDRAMGLLDGVIDGTLTLTDVDYDAVDGVGHLSSSDFYPNDDTEIQHPEQARKFAVGKIF
jgi:hypothetical protein